MNGVAVIVYVFVIEIVDLVGVNGFGVFAVSGCGKEGGNLYGIDIRSLEAAGLFVGVVGVNALEEETLCFFIIERLFIRNIDDGAVGACSQLARIDLPRSVRTIGDDAFYECKAINYVLYYGNEELIRGMDIGTGNEYFLEPLLANLKENG